MKNKKRLSKRKTKVPVVCNDFVMRNQSQEKDESDLIVNTDEIRVYENVDEISKGEKGESRDEENVDHIEKMNRSQNTTVSETETQMDDLNMNTFCDFNGDKDECDTVTNMKVDNKEKTEGEFRSNEGIERVLEQGPWIVNNKPLFVQKWNPIISMKKVDATRIPVWAKLINIPLEAWLKEGISALASSLGKPLRMDNVTAQICKDGKGRTDFARVLVEFHASKGFKDVICVQYKSKDNMIKGVKKLSLREIIREIMRDGTYRRNENTNDGREYQQKKVMENNREWHRKTLQGVIVDAIRKSPNKFDVLVEDNERQELNMLKDMNKKLQPTCTETHNWSQDMVQYFKMKWEEDRLKDKKDMNEKN
nr:ATPase, F1/V1/A1 complex, alpha/beta subunit, zinc knuckle CX2CX4HX4C [Tanacetum cinerariifolium]